MNYIHDLVSGMAEKRAVENANLFPTYSKWLDRRFADQWQTFNVSSDVADFGVVQWEQRPIDAVVVKTILHQKIALSEDTRISAIYLVSLLMKSSACCANHLLSIAVMRRM